MMLDPTIDPHDLSVVERVEMVRGSKGVLVELLRGVEFDGFLDLRGLDDLRYLPSMKVKRGLYLANNKALERIEGPLEVGESLALEGCCRLHSLPNGLRVGGDLILSRCRELESFPQGLHVGGDLLAESCWRLRTIHPDLYVGGSLSLKRCKALEYIPPGIVIGVRLSLLLCFNVKRIPKGIPALRIQMPHDTRIMEWSGAHWSPDGRTIIGPGEKRSEELADV